jgi:glycosyltransferase involved in cell wall biosynthesis
VIPTFRRREALLAALPNHLALEGIGELIVVDDGSDDGTADAVEALHLERVRVVRHPENRGLPAARNTGAQHARGDWVLYLEDDCGFPADYGVRLMATAEEVSADIVGAPWLHTADNLEARRAPDHPTDSFHLLSAPWAHPHAPLETPFMPALALVRRTVFDTVQYDVGYTGNFYREETDFFVSARRAGFKVMLTPTTASWQLGRFDGGCKIGSQLAYDRAMVRNTRRFLRKHGAWLQGEGLLTESTRRTVLRIVLPKLPFYLKAPARVVRDRWRATRGLRATGSR